MTSDEIRQESEDQAGANLKYPLWEIALQLALMNEKSEKLVTTEAGKSGPTVERGDLWPKIGPDGSGRFGVWFGPGPARHSFDTEAEARSIVSPNYVPPKKADIPTPGYSASSWPTPQNPPSSRVPEPSSEASAAVPKNHVHVTEVAGGACIQCGALWVDWNRSSEAVPKKEVPSDLIEIRNIDTDQVARVDRKMWEQYAASPMKDALWQSAEPYIEAGAAVKKDDREELLESARAYVEAGAEKSGREWERFYKAVGAMRNY